MPWTAIEMALRLACLILEGIPIEQRRATALQWFWTWWPITKGTLPKDVQEQIEKIMKGEKP